MLLKPALCLGKSGRGKAKNKSQASSKETSATQKKPTNQPRLNPLFEAGSDDEALGQEKPLTVLNKFSCIPNDNVRVHLRSDRLLNEETNRLCADLEKLVMYSATTQTWAGHCSAWNLFYEFCDIFGIKKTTPIDIKDTRAFATWAVSKRGLKSSTVKTYLSSLNVAHTISNCSKGSNLSDPCVKMILKGAKNMEGASSSNKVVRLPMSIDLLDILGHKIYSTNWSPYSKQVVWTACTICFYSSCRMGELLPPYEYGFDPLTTLLWENIQIGENKEILIFVPFSKTKGFDGKIIDIFPVKNSKTCPASAIIRLKSLAAEIGTFDPKKPVFALKSGKNFTKNSLNRILMDLLGEFCDDHHKLTGHSFRAAIPSLIGSYPILNSVSELKDWGNWESDSYKLYMKSTRETRKKLFDKILLCMYTDHDE